VQKNNKKGGILINNIYQKAKLDQKQWVPPNLLKAQCVRPAAAAAVVSYTKSNHVVGHWFGQQNIFTFALVSGAAGARQRTLLCVCVCCARRPLFEAFKMTHDWQFHFAGGGDGWHKICPALAPPPPSQFGSRRRCRSSPASTFITTTIRHYCNRHVLRRRYRFQNVNTNTSLKVTTHFQTDEKDWYFMKASELSKSTRKACCRCSCQLWWEVGAALAAIGTLRKLTTENGAIFF
jgi:hypothetical protein